MMRWLKISVLIFCTVFTSNNSASAQDLMQSAGLKVSVLFGNLETEDYDASSIVMKQTVFSYFPRFNFLEGENASLSIGAPIGAGVGLAVNTLYDDIGVSFAFDLPVVLDYNFGCNATPNSESTFGGYFGAGFGYYKVILTGSEYSDFNGVSYGPIIRGGVRFLTSARDWNSNSMTIGLFYKKGMEKSRLNTIGIDVFYDF